jgi:hypothetical protein
MSIFQKLKSFFAPTVPNPLPPLVQPDPKPVVEIETVLTAAPEKEAVVAPAPAVEMPTHPYQPPVTNTDPTPPNWPFPVGAPPVAEVEKKAPARKPRAPKAAAITATPVTTTPAPKKTRSTKKNK